MTTRDQLNAEKIDALCRQLEEIENLTQFRDIRDTGELGEPTSAVSSRSKAVDQIVTDYQAAKSDYDIAVSDYQSAGNTQEQFTAVVDAVVAQQGQIDEIVEFLVMTNDSL